MNVIRLTTALLAASLLAACAREEPTPISVAEFTADPILLEATVVRCAQDRSKTKYDRECVNAREAGNLLAASDREARRKELEAQSERKRKALRRTQEAAAEARRRAAAAQRQREEDEYLGVYEAVPQYGSGSDQLENDTVSSQSTQRADVLPGNQPGAATAPVDDTATDTQAEISPTDIDAVREELRRRQDSSD